jgi:hypothetical protein
MGLHTCPTISGPGGLVVGTSMIPSGSTRSTSNRRPSSGKGPIWKNLLILCARLHGQMSTYALQFFFKSYVDRKRWLLAQHVHTTLELPHLRGSPCWGYRLLGLQPLWGTLSAVAFFLS